MTSADLDRLFPTRHSEAERLGIHPSLRSHFVPVVEGGYSDEQAAVLFPEWPSAIRAITSTVWPDEVLAVGDVRSA